MAPRRGQFPTALRTSTALPGHAQVRGQVMPKGRANGATIYSGGQPAFYEWAATDATTNIAAGDYDVIGNAEHDRTRPLFRADGSPGSSAQLFDDPAGVWVIANIPEAFGGELMLIANGTTPGLSMEFWSPPDGSLWTTGPDGLRERQLTDINFVGVAVCAWPAYPGAWVEAVGSGARSKDAILGPRAAAAIAERRFRRIEKETAAHHAAKARDREQMTRQLRRHEAVQRNLERSAR